VNGEGQARDEGLARDEGPARDEAGGRLAREEAQRLVGAVLGAASMAVRGLEARRQLRDLTEQLFSAGSSAAGSSAAGAGVAGGSSAAGAGSAGQARPGLATGSDECCICPFCRLIVAIRDPSPEFAERLASGAGDLAAGVTSVLRAFADAGSGMGGWAAAGRGSGAPAGAGSGDRSGSADEGMTGRSRAWSGEGDVPDPWRAATTAATGTPADQTGSDQPAPVQPKPMARKAVKKTAPPVDGAEGTAGTGSDPANRA
jgi:hypothetical protein